MSRKALILRCGESEKTAVENSFKEGGVEVLTGEGNDALLAADFLVLVAADADELNGKDAEEKWKFFLDEIRWKRKDDGEVIIVDCSEISFSPSRLPYALKKCKRYRLAQIDEAVRYVATETAQPVAEKKAEPTVVKDTPVSEKKTYVPPVRTESGACRDDHVFGEDTGHKRYVRDDDGGKCNDDHVFEKEENPISEESSEKKSNDLFEEYPDVKKEIRKVAGGGKLAIIVVISIVVMFGLMSMRMCSSIFDLFFQSVSNAVQKTPSLGIVQTIAAAVRSIFVPML